MVPTRGLLCNLVPDRSGAWGTSHFNESPDTRSFVGKIWLSECQELLSLGSVSPGPGHIIQVYCACGLRGVIAKVQGIVKGLQTGKRNLHRPALWLQGRPLVDSAVVRCSAIGKEGERVGRPKCP